MAEFSRERKKAVDRILGDPSLYSDEFKSWIVRYLSQSASFQVEAFQLPATEQTHYVGGTNEPTFQTGWSNFGAGFEEAGFYKDPSGRVHLTGFVRAGAGLIFTLPTGYRPKGREAFVVLDGLDSAGRVDVKTNGDVLYVSGNTTYFQISGISYRAFG